MPRKAPDTVQEHRITFGNLERGLIEDARNIAIARTTTQTVVGLAAGVGAGGLLLAAATLAAWKAPGVLKNALGDAWAWTEDLLGVQVGRDETGKVEITTGMGGLAGHGGVLDDVVGSFTGDMPALRREGQKLAAERGAVAREISAFCTLSASTADAQKCNAAQARKDAYFDKLRVYRARVAQWAFAQGKDPGFIYGTSSTSPFGSLGDIDPAFQ